MNRNVAYPAIGAVLFAGLLMAGCVGSDFGYSATYKGESGTGIGIVMPANAPSIMQQFRKNANSEPGESAARGDHLGIDIVAPEGTPVIAAAPGRILRSWIDPLYGNQIEIDHGQDSHGLRTVTVYRHLSKRLVSAGDVVARGQQIGGLGRTGVLASGILHLHFEVHREIKPHGILPQDPHLFWVNGVGKVTCFDPSVSVDETVFHATYPVVCDGSNRSLPADAAEHRGIAVLSSGAAAS